MDEKRLADIGSRINQGTIAPGDARALYFEVKRLLSIAGLPTVENPPPPTVAPPAEEE